jgi:Regulator of ribonuclease activity B
MIDQLCDYGLTRGRPYIIEFAFYGDRTRLDQFRKVLLSSGYQEDSSQTEDMLVVLRSIPLDLESITTARAEMQKFAAKFDVTFDGWSADVRQS